MNASQQHLRDTYGPQAQKTFLGALESFFAQEFPAIAGDRARRAIVQGIVEMVHRFHPETTNLRPGQTPWVTVAKDEVSSYGKSMSKTRLVSGTLSLLGEDDAAQRRDGARLRDMKINAVARVCNQADAQGGCLTNAELALLFKTTPTTISKYITAWQARETKLLPRRGTIHDMGPTLTHKKEICRLLFLEGRTVQDTCLITKHSPQAVHRYITNFKQVLTCKTKGLTTKETSFATKLSERLVTEYHRLFDEYAVTNDRLQTLLSNTKKT